MTTEKKIKRLEKNGYTLLFNMSGRITAKKNQRIYNAYSINELYSLIFKPSY